MGEDGGNFFESNHPGEIAASKILQNSPMYVRALGVLISWIHDRARDALLRGILSSQDEQDTRPDHAGRRQLLEDVLLERLPGDLSFLAPRVVQVICAFQLHKTLPPVTDVLLYDLLAALLFRAILRADVVRKVRHRSKQDAAILSKQVEDAARKCDMQAADLKALELQLNVHLGVDS